MRRSFPTTFALAALAGVVVCGAASAAMNNSNSSTPALTTTIKTKTKLPAGPPATTSSPMKKATTTATPTSAVSSTNATATAPATPSTASNSSTASTGGKPGLPPAVQLRQDITRQQTDIKKSENYIMSLQHQKLNPVGLLGRYYPTISHPVFRYQIPGGPFLEFTFHFDGAGRMLPGEMDRFNRAARIAIDQTIVAETQRVAAAKKKLAADLAALGGQD